MALPLPVEPLLLCAEALLPGAHRDLCLSCRDGECLGLALELGLDIVEQLRPLGESCLGGRESLFTGVDPGVLTGGLRLQLAHGPLALREDIVAFTHGVLACRDPRLGVLVP